MNKVLIAPRKYVQGRNVLQQAGSLIGLLGKKPMLLWDANVKGIVGETLINSLKKECSNFATRYQHCSIHWRRHYTL